jgi:protein CpxP
MKTSRFKIAAIVAAVVMTAALAVSQTVMRAHYHGHGMYGGRMMGFPARSLNLTDAQRTQMKEVMAKEKPTLSPLFKEMAGAQNQLRQLAMSDNFDEGKARELATQQTQTMTELAVQKARVQSELYKLLTPEQKTKLAQIMQAREQRFQQHTQEAPAPSQ